MATGDVLWKVSGAQVHEHDWTFESQNTSQQTVQFGGYTLTVPAATTSYHYTAGSPLTVVTSYTHENDGMVVQGEVAFDFNKRYTITITEE